MARLSEENRRGILDQIRYLAAGGHSDNVDRDEFRQAFCPIPEHLRALDPNVALVLGERGAGKTELRLALHDDEVRSSLRAFAPNERVAHRLAAKAEWIEGFSNRGSAFADSTALQQFLRKYELRKDVAARFWFASLLRTLAPRLNADECRRVASIIEQPSTRPESIYRSLQGLNEEATSVLDALDRRLEVDDSYLVVTYDALDAFGSPDFDVMSSGIAGLLSLWTEYVRRWNRIKPKIFLRTDLFRANTSLQGSEFAKLSALSAEIVWTDSFLYALLLKRLVNSSEILASFLDAKAFASFHPVLKWVVNPMPAGKARPYIEKMSGAYMGADKKKGLTYTWILHHCRDGNKRALPRALVQLYGYAATHELSIARGGRQARIINSWSLRRALDDVSVQQFDQAKAEWLWMDGLRERVQDERVPMSRREFERLLGHQFLEPWASIGNQDSAPVRPPADNAHDLVDVLIELGIVERRSNGVVNVPDLYAFGLGLRRKGGASRD